MSAGKGEKLLEVEGLSAGYRPGVAALSDVTFEAPAGSITAVLGPNGGGKTTLFRALLGETPQRSGTVRVNGAVAYVPQTERARLDFPVSALDVARMGTYAATPWWRPSGRAGRERAEAALERVGLADRAGVRFGELSGGQRQRVLIARALAQDARVLLLDEPLSGVDGPSAERILGVLAELRARTATRCSSRPRHPPGPGVRRLVVCLHGSQVAFVPPARARRRSSSPAPTAAR